MNRCFLCCQWDIHYIFGESIKGIVSYFWGFLKQIHIAEHTHWRNCISTDHGILMKSVDTSMISRYFEFSIVHQTVPVPGDYTEQRSSTGLFLAIPQLLWIWQHGSRALLGYQKRGFMMVYPSCSNMLHRVYRYIKQQMWRQRGNTIIQPTSTRIALMCLPLELADEDEGA